METTFAYDEVQYENMVYVQTHIERLAVMGKLYGMNRVPTTKCCVLEIGCGDGWNLMPMALYYPESTFYGLDLAGSMIEAGKRRVEANGIHNLHLAHLDLMDLPDDWGQFDYIIAHGFYSWVPDFVRTKLFEICRDRLSPNGLAYISYKVYPGAYLFQISREMMQYHNQVQGIESIEEQVQQGRAVFDLITASLPSNTEVSFQRSFQMYLQKEKARMDVLPDFYLAHDQLAEVSDAVYFKDFMARAAQFDLQFVAEALFEAMQAPTLSRQALGLLKHFEPLPLVREQYLDFFFGRSLRLTILGHTGLKRSDTPIAESLYDLYISAPIRIEKKGENDPEVMIHGWEENRISTSHPLMKRLAFLLQQYFPESVSFETLRKGMEGMLNKDERYRDNPEAQRELMAGILLNLYAQSIIDLHTRPVQSKSALSEKPIALKITRINIAENRSLLVTAFHRDEICEDEIARKLIPILDGSRTAEDCALALGADIEEVKTSLAWLHQHALLEG